MDDNLKIQLIKIRSEIKKHFDCRDDSKRDLVGENKLDNPEEEDFDEICDLLEVESPQILLLLLEWQGKGNSMIKLENRTIVPASSPWSHLRYNKQHLARVVDVKQILVPLWQHKIISFKDVKRISKSESNLEKMENLIDILEQRPSHFFDVFLDSISHQYPHIFLKITAKD